MNRRSCLALLALIAPPLGAQADLPIRDTTLANGLRVIVIENHEQVRRAAQTYLRNVRFVIIGDPAKVSAALFKSL
jgi:16S rRNA C1402 (ribose-2'-O) methylase RsmI